MIANCEYKIIIFATIVGEMMFAASNGFMLNTMMEGFLTNFDITFLEELGHSIAY